MDKPQPKDGEGLREIMRNRGGICLCGDGEAHGEEVGPRVGVSRQSLEGLFCELRVDGVLRSPVTLSAEDAPDFAVYYHRQEYLTGLWETGWAG
jgi:hypothetical protein